jgi:hypothetical protein
MKTDRKIIKSRKHFKKLLILTGIYAIFAAIISFSVIFVINNSIVTHIDGVSNIKGVTESSNVTESNNITTSQKTMNIQSPYVLSIFISHQNQVNYSH